MRAENKNALERLSLVSHYIGLFSVFIGLGLTFYDVLRKDVTHIQISLYVVITGYSFVKISQKIARILLSESTPSQRSMY